ncbi:cell envelope integrity protein TolA [Klebsiella aerogenes]|uniref:cell envelope integrity protein TolA n=1 Tax=Klebsiella aerogenes TaxID=548 RepID=UPI0022787C3F|nr:cell envelope integrity protein TolA [Klebsiella aerogenes]MCY4764343.1 cell envelope integrity protein TolA [Klebsiella aerogenes]
MKKLILASVIALACSSAFAHEVDYKCSREAPNGFVSIGTEYKQIDYINRPYIEMVSPTGEVTDYRYDTLSDLEQGVYSFDRNSVISITSNTDYPLVVRYKDESKSYEYHCQLDDDANKVIAQREAEERQAEADAKAELAASEKVDAETAAETAAKAAAAEAAAAKKAAAAKEAAGVDDLLGDLDTGKSSPKPSHKSVSYGGASGVDISYYMSQVQAAVKSHLYDYSDWAGKQCNIQVMIQADGTITAVDSEGGNPDFCSYVQASFNKINKLPKPPSQAVFESLKTMHLIFKA